MSESPVRLVPREGWLTVALVSALVYVTLQTVELAGWGDRVAAAPRLALLGVVIGLVAAKSGLRSLWALPLAVGVGSEADLLAQAIMSPGRTWAEKLGATSDGLWGWYRTALAQGTTYDPLVFAAVVGLVGFLLGFCCAWLVFRLQAGWLALVLCAAAGIVHLSYATVESIPPFLTSIFLGVLMVASLELHLRRSTWRAIGVPVQAASTGWTLTAAAGLAGLSLLVALQLPAGQINAELAARYQAATEPWKGVQRQVDRLFGGGKGQARPGGGLAFSQSLMPREDFDLGTEPVLKIASPQRQYWRTTSYDRYDGHSIGVTDVAEHRHDASEALADDPDGSGLRLSIEQKVTILAPSAVALFAADAPRSFSVALLAVERQVGWDLAAVRAATPLQRGQSYSVTSLVAMAGRRELAEAPAVYPPWTERYLELPVSLPTRVGELTNQVSASARNPLERALAIEEYLRGLTYSTHTVVPPPDRDWVDYLLFDSRTGYCDYFATAMVVMLRTQAIPARVSSGFAPGTFDDKEKVWLVRESEAHSWAEAYFPGYGWVTFEPSAIRPPPDRRESARSDANRDPGRDGRSGRDPLEVGPLDDDLGSGGGGGFGGGSAEPTPAGLSLGGLGALFVLAGLAVGALAWTWERGLMDEPVARRRFAQVGRWLDWGRWPGSASATPYELAERLGADLPEVAEPLRRLARRHVEATYGPGPGPGSAEESESAWQLVRRPLARAMLRRRFAPGPQRRRGA